MLSLSHFTKESTLDFGADKGGQNWYSLVDGVMGGRSTGLVQIQENSLQLTGNISFENNGGFSSVRSPWGAIDLSKFKTIEIRLKAKGQQFAMVFETSRQWFQPNYKMPLSTDTEDWQVLIFNLADLEATRIGQPMGETITDEQLKNIIRMGFISNLKKEGAFELEIDYIRFK